MERFIERHKDLIKGIIHGFDRLVFRGTLQSIAYTEGMDRFLSSQHILYKNFKAFGIKISARVKEHAQTIAQLQGRPFIHLRSPKESKEKRAREIMLEDQIKEGLICVLTCLEPCHSYTIRRDATKKRQVLVAEPRQCLHIYFYFVDREFGFMHIRLQTWLPLSIQVGMNGREYLARQMDKAKIRYTRRDNCFTDIANIPRAQRLLERLEHRYWPRVLDQWARRINPWINPKSKPRFWGYYWSVRQDEYASDVMFKNAGALATVYRDLTRHAMNHFGSDDVMRFLGRRPDIRFKGEVKTSLERRIEGVRMKHWVDENSIKMYDKQGSVLRIETTINNARRFKVRRMMTRKGRRQLGWVPLRKGVADIRRRTEIARAANKRYLEALSVVGNTARTYQLFDPVSRPRRGGVQGKRSYRPLRPISPQEAKVFAVILRAEFLIQGVRNKDLRQYLTPEAEHDAQRCRKASGQMTRWLSLLRAHGLIYKVSRTHYYRVTKKGHYIMNMALNVRHANADRLAA